MDIAVVMEIDNKYTYRTEIIRKKGRTSSLININESFDALVSVNSLINFKILAPTRLFGRHDLGQLEFNLKSIIEDYHRKEPMHCNEPSPSYRVQLAYQNSTTVSNPFRSNVTNHPSSGMIEVILSGTILKQEECEANQPVCEPVRSQRDSLIRLDVSDSNRRLHHRQVILRKTMRILINRYRMSLSDV
jgi:hypothetical protein